MAGRRSVQQEVRTTLSRISRLTVNLAQDSSGGAPKDIHFAPLLAPGIDKADEPIKTTSSTLQRTLESFDHLLAHGEIEQTFTRHVGKLSQVVIGILFVSLDVIKSACNMIVFANSDVNTQSMVFANSLLSFMVALGLSAGLHGFEGVCAALNQERIMRCFGVAILFTMSQTAILHAHEAGLGVQNASVLGTLYLPICAVLSNVVFKRDYGMLEWQAMVLVSCCAVAFAEFHARASGQQRRAITVHGIVWSLVSTTFAAAGSVLAEYLFKPKFGGAPLGAPESNFSAQYTHLTSGMFVFSIIMLLSSTVIAKGGVGSAFNNWTLGTFLLVCLNVCQGALAGLVVKHLSTVARSVAACLSLPILFFSVETIYFQRPLTLGLVLLSLMITFSSLIFHTGRVLHKSSSAPKPKHDMIDGATEHKKLSLIAGESGQRYNCASVSNIETNNSNAPEMMAKEPDVPRKSRGSVVNVLREDALEDMDSQAKQDLESKSGNFFQIFIVGFFVLADAGRTLVYAWAIGGSPIVAQSLVVLQTFGSVTIGALTSLALDGKPGFLLSLDGASIVKCLPVAACFSLSQTGMITAYSAGISATMATVLGYLYMPLSAVLSNWIFGRGYGWLEWQALLLITLGAILFAVLQQSGRSSSDTSTLGICSILFAVVLSCAGSLLAEKIMKSNADIPFYTQKVHLDLGGFLLAVAMLFVIGCVSTRPKDAFWKDRLVNGEEASGLFVGWEPKTFFAVALSLVQGWVGGLLAKKLSSVVKAAAQCLSLLVIYYIGDLVLKGLPFDWAFSTIAMVVMLSVQIFVQAGQRVKNSTPAKNSPEPDSPQQNIELQSRKSEST